jgi:hypothetical protein
MDAPISHETRKPRELKCERCGSVPRVAKTILDSRTGRSVRMFECECGELIWDD